MVESAEDGGAEIGAVAEAGGNLEHAFEWSSFAGLGNEGGEAIEDRTGLLEIGDGAERGDGLGQGDFTAAGTGESTFAHECVVSVGGEEFGDGLVGIW